MLNQDQGYFVTIPGLGHCSILVSFSSADCSMFQHLSSFLVFGQVDTERGPYIGTHIK